MTNDKVLLLRAVEMREELKKSTDQGRRLALAKALNLLERAALMPDKYNVHQTGKHFTISWKSEFKFDLPSAALKELLDKKPSEQPE